MEAVAALYSEGHWEISLAILPSLSKAIFDAPEPGQPLAPQVLAGINPDTMTEWRKDPEFSGAIKRATAERLLLRLERSRLENKAGRSLPGHWRESTITGRKTDGHRSIPAG